MNKLRLGVIAMAVIVVASNILVQYPIGQWLTWGGLTYPFAFILSELINRFQGAAAARRVVYAGFALGLICSVIGTQINGEYGPLVTLRIAIGSGIAFLISQILEVTVFDKLRRTAWWRAPFPSSLLGSSVDTSLFFTLAFSHAFIWLDPTSDVSWAAGKISLLGFGPEVTLWVSLGLADFCVKVAVDLIALMPFRIAAAKYALVKSELEGAMSERWKVEQRLMGIATVSDGWLWEMNSDRRFVFVLDGAYFDDGGVPKEGLIGKTQEEWLQTNPDMLPGIDWDILLSALNSNKPFQNFVYRAPKSTDGVVRWRRMSGAPVFDAAGTFTGFRGVGSDVTQLYVARAHAEEASRTKSKFLANMSHEIRTPLNGVLGMAEMLERSLVQPDQRRMIATIRRSGEALLNILNDILDMSKIEAGKIEFEAMPFSPLDLAQRIEDQYALRADEKSLEFEVLIGSGAELLRVGDPHRVQQVLHNLVNNAIKFTDSGEVTVKISGSAGMPLLIEVRDTGIGMTPEQILRLHEEFSQADSSVTRRFGGTGLGMSITQSLVDRMGGTIKVVSAPGHGTTITVTLPLPLSTVLPDRVAKTSVDAVGLAGLRLLAADDNQTNCAVLEMMLSRLGAEVVIVNDGAQVVQAWQEGDFDAILLDIAMPVMDGPTALRKIREIEALQDRVPIPIIAVTANMMAHQVADYNEWGFDKCIGKPISSVELSLAISDLVGSGA